MHHYRGWPLVACNVFFSLNGYSSQWEIQPLTFQKKKKTFFHVYVICRCKCFKTSFLKLLVII
jgi:hypothetical protein